jgi:multisubunit Na+/H+ antiporter MnhC subunit
MRVLAVAPPQLTEEELREFENDAASTVKQAVVTAIVLYFCTFTLL